jgi:hypothetical protein
MAMADTHGDGSGLSNLTVTNLCNDLVLIREVKDGVERRTLRLSPLQRLSMSAKDCARWRSVLDAARDHRSQLIRIDEPRPEQSTRWVRVAVAASLLGIVAWAVANFAWNADPIWWIILAGVVAALVAVAGVTASGDSPRNRLATTAIVASIAVLVALVMPALAIYFGMGLREHFWAAYGPHATKPRTSVNLELVIRGIELTFLFLASLLPAALYIVFDRQQLRTLRREFEQAMFQFDRQITRLPDLETRYGEAMEEAFGKENERGRIPPGHPYPLIFATVLISLGWVVTLFATTKGNAPITSTTQMIDMLTPTKSAVVFGFLGAYFFALQVVQRGYARGDLRPKSYATITARLLIVVISAWVLEVLIFKPGDSRVLALAFLIGIVPETLFVWLREVWDNRRLVKMAFRAGNRWRSVPDEQLEDLDNQISSLTSNEPLTRLEGIDLYDRGRLGDEGVTTVEALAHGDIVSLMLYTRIPPPQLLDWVDQAILYIHLDPNQRKYRLPRLAAVGVRGATDIALTPPGSPQAATIARLLYGGSADQLSAPLVQDGAGVAAVVGAAGDPSTAGAPEGQDAAAGGAGVEPERAAVATAVAGDGANGNGAAPAVAAGQAAWPEQYEILWQAIDREWWIENLKWWRAKKEPRDPQNTKILLVFPPDAEPA